jgi:putative phosphoesterase
MRALVISDIHANAVALEKLPDADVVLCAGDVVTYGAQPEETIAWLRSRNAYCVRGEEDDAVAHGVDHPIPAELQAAARETRQWSRSTLSAAAMRWLADLPPELEVTIDGRRIALTHAYPGDLGRYLEPNDEELTRTARAFPHATFIITGHSHRRGCWHVDGTTILNPGSIGQPTRAGIGSFLLIDGGVPRFGELHFDPHRCVHALAAVPLSETAHGQCPQALLRGTSRPRTRPVSKAFSTTP